MGKALMIAIYIYAGYCIYAQFRDAPDDSPFKTFVRWLKAR